MTRKHFEAAARIVRGSSDLSMRSRAQAFIELFEEFSPNFDRARFLKACGL